MHGTASERAEPDAGCRALDSHTPGRWPGPAALPELPENWTGPVLDASRLTTSGWGGTNTPLRQRALTPQTTMAQHLLGGIVTGYARLGSEPAFLRLLHRLLGLLTALKNLEAAVMSVHSTTRVGSLPPGRDQLKAYRKHFQYSSMNRFVSATSGVARLPARFGSDQDYQDQGGSHLKHNAIEESTVRLTSCRCSHSLPTAEDGLQVTSRSPRFRVKRCDQNHQRDYAVEAA